MWVDFKDSVGESWGQSLGFCRVTPEKGGAPSHGSYSPRQHRTPNTTHTASGVTCALGLTDPGAGLPPGGLEFLGPPSVLLILGCRHREPLGSAICHHLQGDPQGLR